jgi:hypothetical protein
VGADAPRLPSRCERESHPGLPETTASNFWTMQGGGEAPPVPAPGSTRGTLPRPPGSSRGPLGLPPGGQPWRQDPSSRPWKQALVRIGGQGPRLQPHPLMPELPSPRRARTDPPLPGVVGHPRRMAARLRFGKGPPSIDFPPSSLRRDGVAGRVAGRVPDALWWQLRAVASKSPRGRRFWTWGRIPPMFWSCSRVM